MPERDYFDLSRPIAEKVIHKYQTIFSNLRERGLNLLSDKVLYSKFSNPDSGDSLVTFMTQRADSTGRNHDILVIQNDGLHGIVKDTFRRFTFEEVNKYCPNPKVLEEIKKTSTLNDGIFLRCDLNQFNPIKTSFNVATDIDQQSYDFTLQYKIAQYAQQYSNLADEALLSHLGYDDHLDVFPSLGQMLFNHTTE